MKEIIGFLLFEDVEDMDFVGPWEMLGLWKKYFAGPEHIITVNETGDLVKTSLGLNLQPDYDFNACPQLDYLIVPGGMGTRKQVDNITLIDFIAKQARHCQHILSVCTGAFLLQKAGLLQGKKATTHWASLDRLRNFSDLKVVEQRFVRDGNIWTAAGISAGVDLALAFIAEIAGEKVAAKVQLQAEYYPLDKRYPLARDVKLPAYLG